MTKGTGNVRTEYNSRTANVVFDVKGLVHRLKFPRKELETKETLFGLKPYVHIPSLKFDLFFPAEESINDLCSLKDMWDDLVKHGFKKVK
jgi:hypothetical protein